MKQKIKTFTEWGPNLKEAALSADRSFNTWSGLAGIDTEITSISTSGKSAIDGDPNAWFSITVLYREVA